MKPINKKQFSMARGLLGGMTDYSHQSFTDIVSDLQSEQRNVTAFIDKIEQNLKIVIANGFWNSKVISNFQLQIAYSIKHYKTSRQELGEIANEIVIEVKEHHCKRLQKLSDVAHEINVEIGRIWHQDYEEHGVKDYDDPNFRIVEDIYADTRDMAVNLLDMANIADRLKDFIGKQSLESIEGKKKFKLELGHKIALISLAVALLVFLFGNNILGRLESDKDSKTLTDSTMVVATKHDTAIISQELPYLENVPIIDKGLFIKYYFNEFVFGGVNIDTISIGARTESGESLKVSKSSNEIQLDITQEPYIEFEYKGTLYSIETNGKHYSFLCTIRKNIKQTLKLKKYSEI